MPRIKEFLSKSFKYIKTHKKLLIIPVILTIIIVAAVAYPRTKEKIETQKVTSGDLIQSISANGTIEADNSVALSFLVGGKVTFLAGKPGDLISKNSALVTLDQRSVSKNIQNALLDYSIQRNTFDQTLKNNNAETISDAISDTIKRTLQTNQYNLDKSVLSLELQNLAKDQTYLISPISGIITRMDIQNTGVNAKITDVFEVTDPNSLFFKLEIDEADIGKIMVGQSVDLILDAYPDETLKIVIDHIDFKTHATSTGGDAYFVTGPLTFDNSNYKYRVGMNGSAEVILDKISDVILIPTSSLFEENKVYVVNGKKYEKRTLKLGAQNDTEAQVLEGLNVNDEIVLDPTKVK